jgi:predicted lipid carrier protein YhbT
MMPAMLQTLFLSGARLPLRFIPDAVHTTVFAHAFNHLLRGQKLVERLAEIDGKTVCIDITDAPCRLHFRIESGRLAQDRDRHADVYIRGRLEDFWQLATRAEDPDTLFFSRRLAIEGDTETGLHVKNLLDSLEYDFAAHVRAVLDSFPFPVPAALTELLSNAARRGRTSRRT